MQIKNREELYNAIETVLKNANVSYKTFAEQAKVGPNFDGLSVSFKQLPTCDIVILCNKRRK